MTNKKIFILAAVALAIVAAAGFYIDTRPKIESSQSPADLPQSVDDSVIAVKPGFGLAPKPVTDLSKKADLRDYGKAPDFTGIDKWLNSGPLTMEGLKGKVVLIDFWTYSCINCIRTLPYVTKWYDAYKDKGFVVIGVHTPEFAFEKNSDNVLDAMKHFNINYPVAQDNEYGTWNAYGNQYWPAEYLIDKNGVIVHRHFGEGEYDITENTIRYLLGMDMNISDKTVSSSGAVRSPEMYLGTFRLQNLTNEQVPSPAPKTYSLSGTAQLNVFALDGNWQFDAENLQLVTGTGKIRLKFNAGKIHMVASSEIPAMLNITVDGKDQPSVIVADPKLYTLFDSNDYAEHVIEITVSQSQFKAFTFTFG